jgi:hypothetical protein
VSQLRWGCCRTLLSKLSGRCVGLQSISGWGIPRDLGNSLCWKTCTRNHHARNFILQVVSWLCSSRGACLQNTMFYVIAVVGGIYLMYLVTKYIKSYPQRKLLRQQEREIEEILGGFDTLAERAKVLRLLRESLPEAYHCGRRRCMRWSPKFGQVVKSGFCS